MAETWYIAINCANSCTSIWAFLVSSLPVFESSPLIPTARTCYLIRALLPTMTHTPNDYLKVAVETALEAGNILRQEFGRPPDIAYKGDVDLVTQADRRSEQAIVARLSKHFPEHSISAEEGTGHAGS